MVENGIITACGTSLGGDDGIAVAMAMAILDSNSIIHPPLEVVITSDEEIGMLGAEALDCSDLKGKLLLNVDSEEEGIFLSGCAGGATVTAHLPVTMVKMPASSGKVENPPHLKDLTEDNAGSLISDNAKNNYRSQNPACPVKGRLVVSGLTGGHSGSEIDKGRANAFVLLARALDDIRQTAEKNNSALYLSTLSFSYSASVSPPKKKLFSKDICRKVTEQTAGLEKIFKNEFHKTEKNLSLQLILTEFHPETKTASQGITSEMHPSSDLSDYEMILNTGSEDCIFMDEVSTNKAIDMLLLLPNGIQKMSMDIPGLVQTSLNMGILETDENEVRVSFSARSSVSSEKMEMIRRIGVLMKLMGGTVSVKGDYPAWEYKEESELRPVMEEVFEQQYGRKPKWEMIHAGVECGIFSSKIKGLDAVSFGPDLKDIHSPRESMDIASVKRTWDYLLAVLKALAGMK